MMKALMLAVALISSPAVPQTAESIPVDAVARAKFPRDDGRFIDALAAINRFVNEAITPVSDEAHYGAADLWVMAPADMKGDCEDYSLTKLMLLQRAGYPIVTSTRIVGVIVHKANGEEEGHAILAVRTPKGAVAYLDNMQQGLMTRAELKAKGYQFFDWRA